MANEYRELKRQQYLQLLQECARSGKSKREWCAQTGVKYSTFMRWQGILRDEPAGQLLPVHPIVPVEFEPPQQEPSFVQSSNWQDCNTAI